MKCSYCSNEEGIYIIEGKSSCKECVEKYEDNEL